MSKNSIEITKSTNVNVQQEINNYIQYGNQKINRYLTQLPSPRSKVIGRESYLTKLSNTLNHSSKAVLISGIGGIGKTSTAMAFANKHKANYKHIVWIEQVKEFTTDLVTNKLLCKNLEFTPSNDSKLDTHLILNILSNLKGKSLLIIDNATDDISDFKSYLPKAPDWHVIITSREELGFTENIPLAFLSEESAIDLFYEYYTLDRNDTIVKTIIETLDYHTLTIELLSKAAQNRHINSIVSIVTLLKERGLQIGRKINIKTDHSQNERIQYLFPYLLAIFEIGNIDLNDRHLLKQFIGLPSSFIHGGKIIELLGIKPENENEWDEITISLSSLKEKGWLIYEEQENNQRKFPSYKMHRIIQDVLKEKLQPTFEDLAVLLKNISAKLHIDQALDNPIEKFQYIKFGERINQILIGSQENIYAVFLSNLATVYQNFGKFNEAKNLMAKSVEIYISIYGGQHSSTITCLSNLALIHHKLGNDKEAKEIMTKVLDFSINIHGEQHPKTATSLSNLALVYQTFGKYEEAANLIEEAIQIDILNFGENHPYTAGRRSNLALVYNALGLYPQAKELAEKALKSDILNFGEEHPSTARSRSNLGLVYKALGRYKDAVVLMEKTHKFTLLNFGESHPRTSGSRSNLASIYHALGRNDEAISLFKKALSSDKSIFGEQHSKTISSLSALALSYKAVGKYQDAADILEKVLEISVSTFGENHPSTNINRSNLGLSYHALGLYPQAKELAEKALKYSTLTLGKKHPSTITNLSNLALAYQSLRKYPKSAELLEEALPLCIQAFGKTHPATVKNQSNLAMTYKELGKHEKAIPLMQKSLHSSIISLGEKHVTTAINHFNLGILYQDIDKNHDAKIQMKKAYSIFREKLGEKHPNTKSVERYLNGFG